ncbi:ubiquinol-cytochrome-c reductase complex assembly factor 2-like [Stegodyphus dumicola]|uniref:ubiquinol-cytochrome-c reductase complex assembly factor 2-like n=1 Tax=Stegodyphus dumicola TaxID=202533 RepID=UPI0015AD8EA7|nr:ubiquinol-cytochrome-c reductase complex assembly factor 2-like [Stegodyphus dumicola]
MAAQLYRGYLRVCEKWGVDSSKKGRDLGEFIRTQVAKEFAQGEATSISQFKDCEKKLESLNRLVSNHYKNQYQFKKSTAASRLTYEECKQILSTEGLKNLNEQKLGFIEKVKLKLLN